MGLRGEGGSRGCAVVQSSRSLAPGGAAASIRARGSSVRGDLQSGHARATIPPRPAARCGRRRSPGRATRSAIPSAARHHRRGVGRDPRSPRRSRSRGAGRPSNPAGGRGDGVRRSGAPATAAIRGATAEDTPVYLAGVRLNDDVGGTADLRSSRSGSSTASRSTAGTRRSRRIASGPAARFSSSRGGPPERFQGRRRLLRRIVGREQGVGVRRRARPGP